MKLTIVGPTHPYKGGISQHTTELAHRLAGAGHDVDLLSWSAQYPAFLYPGQLELSAPSSERAFPDTRRSLAWFSPASWWRGAGGETATADLVVFALVNALQVPAYAVMVHRLRAAGIPTAAICHNVRPHDTGRAQAAVMAAFLRAVDHVTVHNTDEAELAQRAGVDEVRIAPLPFHFPGDIAADPAGGAPTTRRLLSLGFVRPYKGIDVLIEALGRTREPVRATVAGEFWMPVDDLRALAERVGVADRVDLVDRYLEPDDIGSLLADHDALVLPYRSGTGSQLPQIAHLAGRPVIASSVGALRTQVRDGVDGLLVPPGDVDALAAAIDSLYEDGRLESLRDHVRPPDTDAEWRTYLDAVLAPGRGSAPAGDGSSRTGRVLRSAVSYVPSTSLLRLRRARDLPLRLRGIPHEPDFELLRSFPWNRPSVLDVGANRGQTIESLRCVLDEPQITAVEPNPVLADCLRRLYGDGVVVHAVGLADRPGRLELHIPRYGHTMYDTRASLDQAEAEGFLGPTFFARFDPSRAGVVTVEVPVQRLDDLEVEPDLIKLDVEGVDDLVIDGARRTLERCRPALLIERPQAAVIERLGELGYRAGAYDHRDHAFRPATPADLNTFFVLDDHVRDLRAAGVRVEP